MAFALSLLYAFLMLLLPLAEALYNNRSPGALLYLYWVESIALLILHSARIVLHQRWSDAAGHRVVTARVGQTSERRNAVTHIASDASRFTFLSSFAKVSAAFTIVHGVFVLMLVFVFHVIGKANANDLTAATIWGAGVPLGLFLIDLSTLRRWSFTRLQDTVGTLGLRLIVTQFGLVLGWFATIFAGPWGMIGTFFVFRVLSDGLLDWSKRAERRGVMPLGFARLVAKQEKKSIEQVNEEFLESMKADRELQAVLNTPFAELQSKRKLS